MLLQNILPALPTAATSSNASSAQENTAAQAATAAPVEAQQVDQVVAAPAATDADNNTNSRTQLPAGGVTTAENSVTAQVSADTSAAQARQSYGQSQGGEDLARARAEAQTGAARFAQMMDAMSTAPQTRALGLEPAEDTETSNVTQKQVDDAYSALAPSAADDSQTGGFQVYDQEGLVSSSLHMSV
ncbi:hypothetical protein BFP70_16790 [Thioclava sp. SK-1]|uniref:hypothetical protein n=1 Tax=Thioclava sp. SK-1 TaxID=1889770 RepID=UPI0008251B16|nr:hypothetical protein [Thioclava sp. SK-1]OCX61102.1 hypothetical protein BFP70_16790 [Thioclava sp. SK-1]